MYNGYRVGLIVAIMHKVVVVEQEKQNKSIGFLQVINVITI